MADKDDLSRTRFEPPLPGDGLNRGKATAEDLLRALAVFLKEWLRLLALEGRLAIISAIVMLAAGMLAAVLVVSVWLILLAALAVALIEAGLPWTGVLLCIAAANAILALFCWFLIRRLSRNLLFTATFKSLWPKDSQSSAHAHTDST